MGLVQSSESEASDALHQLASQINNNNTTTTNNNNNSASHNSSAVITNSGASTSNNNNNNNNNNNLSQKFIHQPVQLQPATQQPQPQPQTQPQPHPQPQILNIRTSQPQQQQQHQPQVQQTQQQRPQQQQQPTNQKFSPGNIVNKPTSQVQVHVPDNQHHGHQHQHQHQQQQQQSAPLPPSQQQQQKQQQSIRQSSINNNSVNHNVSSPINTRVSVDKSNINNQQQSQIQINNGSIVQSTTPSVEAAKSVTSGNVNSNNKPKSIQSGLWFSLVEWVSPLLPLGVVLAFDEKIVQQSVLSIVNNAYFKQLLSEKHAERRKKKRLEAQARQLAIQNGEKINNNNNSMIDSAEPVFSGQNRIPNSPININISIPYELAQQLLIVDKSLSTIRLQYVPSKVSEIQFWEIYFNIVIDLIAQHVLQAQQAIKQHSIKTNLEGGNTTNTIQGTIRTGN